MDTRLRPDKYLGLNNYYGLLSKEIKKRIDSYIENPTVEGWDDIHGIILRAEDGFGFGLTMWQAVIALDPTSPRSCSEVGHWERIPDVFTIRRALKYAQKAKRYYPVAEGDHGNVG